MNAKKSYLRISGGLAYCKDEIEANIFLNKSFAEESETYIFPDELLYKWEKAESLHNTDLFRFFEQNPVFNQGRPWHYYVNNALSECVRIQIKTYNVEKRFALSAILYKYDGFGVDVCYESAEALRIFTIVYAIQYLQSEPLYLDDIERCIIQQCNLDAPSYGLDVFDKVKKYISEQKGILMVDIPQPKLYKDALNEINWRVETCNFDDAYIERIAESRHGATEKKMVLRHIQDCIRQVSINSNLSQKDDTIRYYIEQLSGQTQEIEQDLSVVDSNKLPTYPIKLTSRKRLKTDKAQMLVSKYFQEHYFEAANIVNIRYVFFGEGIKPEKPLVLKTSKGELVMFISYLVGKKVDDSIWEYFASMIYSRGEPVFPIDQEKRRSNPPAGHATKMEKTKFEQNGIIQILKIALDGKELTQELKMDIR